MQTEHADEHGELEGIRRQTLKSHNKETSQILARNTLNTRLKSSLDLENNFVIVLQRYSVAYSVAEYDLKSLTACHARGLIRQRLG